MDGPGCREILVSRIFGIEPGFDGVSADGGGRRDGHAGSDLEALDLRLRTPHRVGHLRQIGPAPGAGLEPVPDVELDDQPWFAAPRPSRPEGVAVVDGNLVWSMVGALPTVTSISWSGSSRTKWPFQ